jgi:hypothetical protein
MCNVYGLNEQKNTGNCVWTEQAGRKRRVEDTVGLAGARVCVCVVCNIPRAWPMALAHSAQAQVRNKIFLVQLEP